MLLKRICSQVYEASAIQGGDASFRPYLLLTIRNEIHKSFLNKLSNMNVNAFIKDT